MKDEPRGEPPGTSGPDIPQHILEACPAAQWAHLGMFGMGGFEAFHHIECPDGRRWDRNPETDNWVMTQQSNPLGGSVVDDPGGTPAPGQDPPPFDFPLGDPGRPVVGDWDGDGVDEIGVHHGQQFYLDTPGDGRWDESPKEGAGDDPGGTPVPGQDPPPFPLGGDSQPAVGDWDGDGTDDIGISNPGPFHGEDRDDYLSGGREEDLLVGRPGNDRVLGGDGRDVVDGPDEAAPVPVPRVPWWKTPVGIVSLTGGALLAIVLAIILSNGGDDPITAAPATSIVTTTTATTTAAPADPAPPAVSSTTTTTATTSTTTTTAVVVDPLATVPGPVVDLGRRLGIPDDVIPQFDDGLMPVDLPWVTNPGFPTVEDPDPPALVGYGLFIVREAGGNGLVLLGLLELDRPFADADRIGAGTQLGMGVSTSGALPTSGPGGFAEPGWETLQFLDPGYQAFSPGEGFAPFPGGYGFFLGNFAVFAHPADGCLADPSQCAVLFVNFFRGTPSDQDPSEDDGVVFQRIGATGGAPDGVYHPFVTDDPETDHLRGLGGTDSFFGDLGTLDPSSLDVMTIDFAGLE